MQAKIETGNNPRGDFIPNRFIE